jgi:hypothetical protein
MKEFRLTYAVGEEIYVEVLVEESFKKALDLALEKIKEIEIMGFGLVEIQN